MRCFVETEQSVGKRIVQMECTLLQGYFTLCRRPLSRGHSATGTFDNRSSICGTVYYILLQSSYLKRIRTGNHNGSSSIEHADQALRTTLAKTGRKHFFALDQTKRARTFDDYLTEAQSLTLTDRYYSGILYFKLEDYRHAAEQLAVVGERETVWDKTPSTIWESHTSN